MAIVPMSKNGLEVISRRHHVGISRFFLIVRNRVETVVGNQVVVRVEAAVGAEIVAGGVVGIMSSVIHGTVENVGPVTVCDSVVSTSIANLVYIGS
jgi:hypothetical protein